MKKSKNQNLDENPQTIPVTNMKTKTPIGPDRIFQVVQHIPKMAKCMLNLDRITSSPKKSLSPQPRASPNRSMSP